MGMSVSALAVFTSCVVAEEPTAPGEPTFQIEAAPRHDRVWPTTSGVNSRIDDAFTLLRPTLPEFRDEAATRNGRVMPETVPTPPAVEVPPASAAAAPAAVTPTAAPTAVVEPALRSDAISAYAMPQSRPGDAIEAALAKGPGSPIAVPLPKRRPTPPVAPAAPGEGMGEGEPEAAPSGPRVAALTPEVPTAETAKAAAATAEPMGDVVGEGGGLGEPKKIPKEALPYLSILRREAAAQKVPLWLAVGVGWVESKYNPKLRGTHGVVGIMQVMPSTARFQGYKGTTEQLLDAETNIIWGIRELAWDWQKAGGNVCLTIAKYKGGIMTKTIPSAAASYCAAVKRVTGMN